MRTNYSFEHTIIKPLEEYDMNYANNSILLVGKYSSEIEFRHNLEHSPLGIYIDNGIIILGKLVLEPPCHEYSFDKHQADILFTNDDRLRMFTQHYGNTAEVSIVLSRTPVLCNILNMSFIVRF